MIPLARPDVGEEEKDRIEAVLDSGQLSRGSPTQAFEAEFASFCDVDHGIATANGTAALHAALVALGLGEGDRIVTSPFSFVASANAIRLCGATPVFADIDPETFNLDPDAVREVVEREPIDAILVVHAYGLSADLGPLVELAEKEAIPLIEDAAEAHGAEYNDQPVGSIGDVGCFSFYATKNMTTGEGGMIVTDRDDVARNAARFVNHGRDGGGRCVDVGHNLQISDLTGAMGRAQLEKLPEFNAQRRSNADHFTNAFSDIVAIDPPVEPEWARHVYYVYTIRCDDRDGLRRHLERNDIQSGIYWSPPINDEPLYQSTDCSVPVTERAADEVLSLPIHTRLSTNDLETIVSTVLDYFDDN